VTTSDPPGPGSRLVEELRLLLDAVADRAGPWLDQVATTAHEEHAQPAGAPGWCPVCAVLALVRGEPDGGGPLAAAACRAEGAGYYWVATRGLERAADLVALLRAVLADRWEPGVPHMPGFRPPPRESPRVQRIPVRRKGNPG
jgi:hypothetical protein